MTENGHKKAVFLDRDGVINELIYYAEHGVIDSPFTAEQFRLLPGICEAINLFHQKGFVVAVTSNQPGLSKGNFSRESFERIRVKMKADLAAGGAFVDDEFYCFHHPEAKIASMRIDCDCRKPRPGMLKQAADKMHIDLARSWMIGDNVTDVMAGKAAGCKTILVSKMKCELCHLISQTEAHPDFIMPNILGASGVILEHSA